MATKLHSAVSAGARHPIHQLTYPDAANRIAGTNEGTGATPKDFDVAKQDDDDSLWLLTDATGPTWMQIAGPSLSISGDLTLGGDLILTAGGAIETTANGDITLSPNGTGYIKNTKDYFTDYVLGNNSNTFLGVLSTPAGLSHTAATEGWRNTNLGYDAGSGITTGYNNACFGYQAGKGITTGYGNLCFGATNGNVLGTGAFNVLLGVSTGQEQTGDYSVNIGVLSGQYANGANNVAIGYGALRGATGASVITSNTAVGSNAGNSLITGGSSNSFFGVSAGRYVTSGNNNLCLGALTANTLTTGDYAVIIGAGVEPASATADNQLNICNVITCSNWKSNGNLVLIPNGTGITVIGDAGSTSHSLAANDDLLITGKCEIDGTLYADASIQILDNNKINLGNSNDTAIDYSTSQATSNTLVWGFSNEGNSLILTNIDWANKDHDHAAQTNPTIFLHADTDPDVDNTQWIGLSHNKTDPVISAGKGTLTVPTYVKHTSIPANAAVLGPNAPTATTIGTARGLGFDADNEAAYLQYEVPDSWVSGTSLTLRIYWSPEAGAAIGDTLTVKWDVTYRSLAAGEAMDNGTATTATATYTQSGAGTDKEFIETDITIVHNDANQPLAAGDLVVIQFDRDFSADTYASDGIVYRWEINASVNKLE